MIRWGARRCSMCTSPPFNLLQNETARTWIKTTAGYLPNLQAANDTSKRLSGHQWWWWLVCNALKQRCFMALLISHVERVVTVGVCSPLYYFTLRPSERSCCSAPRNEDAQRTNWPHSVHHCQGWTSPAQRRACVSNRMLRRKSCQYHGNTCAKRAGNTAPRQLMTTPAYLDVMGKNDCDWSVIEFIRVSVRRGVSALRDGSCYFFISSCTRLDCVDSTTVRAFVQSFCMYVALIVSWKSLPSLAYRRMWNVLRYGLAQAKSGGMSDNWTVLCPCLS